VRDARADGAGRATADGVSDGRRGERDALPRPPRPPRLPRLPRRPPPRRPRRDPRRPRASSSSSIVLVLVLVVVVVVVVELVLVFVEFLVVVLEVLVVLVLVRVFILVLVAETELRHQRLLALEERRREGGLVELRGARAREDLVLLFLDVMAHVLAEHLDERRVAGIVGRRRVELRDQLARGLVLDHRFLEQALVVVVQCLAQRRIEQLFLDRGVHGQQSSESVGDDPALARFVRVLELVEQDLHFLVIGFQQLQRGVLGRACLRRGAGHPCSPLGCEGTL
jgi:hypothetical protein